MATISTDANYSAGSYSNNANFTIEQGAKFTIDQSTVDIRFIRCLTFGELELKNTSTTQPIIVALGSTGGSPQLRMEGAGVVSTDSDWIVLGTGNGTAGQTFNVPLAQGVNGSGTQSCPDLGWLFVFGGDTFRDGSAAPRLAMQVSADNYANATTHKRCGNVFTHDTTANTVTFKLAVPLGEEVRMPNVIVRSGATLSSAYFSLDANPNGVYNLDKTLWTGSFDFNFKSGKKQTIKNSGFKTDVARIFDLTSQVEAPEVENLGFYADLSMSAPYSISNSAAAGSHKNVWVDNPANLGAFNIINIANTSGAYLEMITATCYTAGTSSTTSNSQRGVINITSPDTTIYDLYNFSNHQSINVSSGASNVIIDNIEFRPACRDDVANQLNIGIFRFFGSIGGATVTNVTTMDLANSYTYSNALVVSNGCKNITVSGVTLRSGASGSGLNRINNIVNDNGNGSRYNDITVYGQTKARTVTFGANSLGCKISNLYFVDEQVDTAQADTVGARCRMDQVYMHTNNVANTAIASSVDTLSLMMLRDTADGGTVEKVDGRFFLRMSPTDEQTDYYTEITKTGVIVFNNNNQLYIENSGDIIELESFVHNNVSSISSTPSLRGGSTGDFDITVKMRRPEGTYTSYVALTQSAMQTAYATLASDAQNRVQFKFRIEKNTTSLSSYLQDIAFDCTLTGNDYPFVLNDPIDVTFTGLVAGSQVVVFEAGTTTEKFRINSSGTTAQWTEAYTADIDYDFTVMKTGLFPIRVTGSTASDKPITINIDQILDRAYQVSSGLSYGVTASLTGTNFDVTTATTVQNWYSFWIEQWISNAALVNKTFPISTFGPNSFSLDDGHEFTGSSLQHLSRDGFRYFASGAVTARYAAILSQGTTAGLQAEYQQELGGAITDAQNTGNVDQVIQIFGDATHGNFDYTGYLAIKVQANGFRQAEVDVVSTFGTLEEQFYVVGLNTLAIPGITTGDPGITGVTITDNSAAPVSWDAGDGAKDYSITITDTGSNSGQDILDYLNYFLSLDATFQGKDPFFWPEMVLDNGAAFETLRGTLYKGTGNVLVGVRVIDGSGDPHPDFTRFQADDGTYGTPPVLFDVSITNIVSGSRLQIYNVTTATEIYNNVVVGTSYSEQYIDGNNYTTGDVVRVRLTYQSGTAAKLGFTANAVAASGGWSVLAEQEDDTVYNGFAVDGSTVTGFTADYVDDEVDVSVASNFNLSDWYSWWVYNLTTSQGIQEFFGGVVAVDAGNFRVVNSLVNIFWDNTTSTNVYATDNRRFYRDDGARPVKAPTTGSGDVDVEWRNPVLVATGGFEESDRTQLFSLPQEQDIVDGVWDEPLTGATHNDPTSAGRRLRQASAWLSAEGEVGSSPSLSSVATNLTKNEDDFYNDHTFVFLSGPQQGQARIIEDYDGTTKTITFDEDLTSLPTAGDEFAILANHEHTITQIKNGVLQGDIESGYSLEESIRLQNAILLGKASQAPNGTIFRDIADTKDRVISKTDDDGNRKEITLDET